MSVSAGSVAARLPRRTSAGGAGLTRGIAVGWMSIIVLLPLAALVVRSLDEGLGAFWTAVTDPQAVNALKLTLLASLAVVAINLVMGTVIAWILVRDEFPGKGLVNSLIDLPFALPTIVAGLTLLALYGPDSPFGINVAYTRIAVLLALLFVTLPFVVRAVQPVLLELDREMEEAAASLGARGRTIFARIILPNLAPAMVAGVALAFARAVGEFGSVVLISGNLPNQTEVASVFIFGQIEIQNVTGAAAVSVVLLLISLLTLVAINLVSRWATKHDR